MRTEAFRDTRLLDALEYIDDEYIASAAVYKMKYAEEVHEHKMTWRTMLKHRKLYIVLVASLLLLSFSAPIVGYISQAISNFRAGAGSDVIETPPPIQTEALETEPEVTEAEIIDSGFDKYLEAFADMSAEEIYAEVLKGGWVVIGEDNSDFAAGGELWYDFFEKTQKGESTYVLVAKYSPNYSRDDIKEPVIFLREIVFDGDLYYHKCIFSLTNEIIAQEEYKYLRYSNDNQEFTEPFAFLTNQEDISWSDLRDHYFSSYYVPELELFNEFNYLIFHLYG